MHDLERSDTLVQEMGGGRGTVLNMRATVKLSFQFMDCNTSGCTTPHDRNRNITFNMGTRPMEGLICALVICYVDIPNHN